MGTYTWDEFNDTFGGPPDRDDPSYAPDYAGAADQLRDEMDEDRSAFADPGGRSALRAGVRKYACPTCKQPDRLTASDKARGYQCDECADKAEGAMWP